MISPRDRTPSTEVDLNITPIIDCFTVLVTFLLASASFLSIGFFEVETPGRTQTGQETPPGRELTLRVRGNHRVELEVKGGRGQNERFNLSEPKSREHLLTVIARLKTESAHLNEIRLTAEDGVPFESLSEAMGPVALSGLPVVLGDF